MPNRDDEGPSPAGPRPRPRRNRLSEARGYHPRARALGENRPSLRLVSDDDEPDGGPDRTVSPPASRPAASRSRVRPPHAEARAPVTRVPTAQRAGAAAAGRT